MQALASLFEELLSSLIPVLVVADALGMLPIVLSLTECMDKREECSAVHNAHYPWSWPGFCRFRQTCLHSIGDIAAALPIGWWAHFAALGCQTSPDGRAGRDTQLSAHANHCGFRVSWSPVLGPAVVLILLVLTGRYFIPAAVITPR